MHGAVKQTLKRVRDWKKVLVSKSPIPALNDAVLSHHRPHTLNSVMNLHGVGLHARLKVILIDIQDDDHFRVIAEPVWCKVGTTHTIKIIIPHAPVSYVFHCIIHRTILVVFQDLNRVAGGLMMPLDRGI